MGLAASQARLLFITMRQNDVSAKMQRISNDKLILARDEEEVSEKYNKMLNAKKYEAVDGVNLSYSALMAQGKTLTDANGSIILDTSSYSELQKNGYIKNNEESGTLNLGDKTSFVANMAGLSAEKSALAELSLDDYIQKNSSAYPTLAANPTRPSAKSESKEYTLDSLFGKNSDGSMKNGNMPSVTTSGTYDVRNYVCCNRVSAKNNSIKSATDTIASLLNSLSTGLNKEFGESQKKMQFLMQSLLLRGSIIRL